MFSLVAITLNSYSWLERKNGFFLDEVHSFMQANHTIISLSETLEAVRNNLGDELKEKTFAREFLGVFESGDLISKCSVSGEKNGFHYSNIYAYESISVHPPLYHFVLHTVSSILRTDNIKLIGFCVNLLFMLISCVFIGKIVVLTTDNKWLALITILYYGFSYEFVSSVTFFRMYAMLSMELTVLCYLYLRQEQIFWNSKKSDIVLIILIQIISMLTHYYAVFMLLPLFIVEIFTHKNDKRVLLKLLKINVASGLFFLFLWPQSIPQLLFTDKGQCVRDNLVSIDSISHFRGYLNCLINSLFGGSRLYFVIFFLIVVLLVCLIRKCKTLSFSILQKKYLLLLFPALFYFVVVAKVSPWVSFRYESPVMPILSILVVLTLWVFSNWVIKRELYSLIILAGVTLFSSIAWIGTPIRHLYTKTPEKKALVEKYSGYKAIVVSAYDNPLHIEVAANFPHPQYLVSDIPHIDTILAPILHDEEYVLYYSKKCTTDDWNKLMLFISENEYSYDVVPYATDFHEVYFLRKL